MKLYYHDGHDAWCDEDTGLCGVNSPGTEPELGTPDHPYTNPNNSVVPEGFYLEQAPDGKVRMKVVPEELRSVEGHMKSAIRVYLKYANVLQADTSPPLGDPGGICQVMKRIDDKVKSPALKEELMDDVSKGKDISNQEASKVYPLDHEANGGIAKQLVITSHAQYRMDLRGVTVKDVQTTLKNYAKLMQDFKAMKHPGFERMQREIASGKVEFVDPKTNLMVVFSVHGRESVTIISTFWKGKGDPKPLPPSSCKLAHNHYLSIIAGITLKEDPWSYFLKPSGTFLVPLSQVETIRARPTGIENAEKHMENAADGRGKKRGPITVHKNEHGKYTVLDGNSTTNIAKKHGWKSIPAVLGNPDDYPDSH